MLKATCINDSLTFASIGSSLKTHRNFGPILPHGKTHSLMSRRLPQVDIRKTEGGARQNEDERMVRRRSNRRCPDYLSVIPALPIRTPGGRASYANRPSHG